jgi:hypothetical protein
MSAVFQNIDPHPLTARRVCTSPPLVPGGGGHTRWVEMGWGVNSSEDARHSSVRYSLYICKYFVQSPIICHLPNAPTCSLTTTFKYL